MIHPAPKKPIEQLQSFRPEHVEGADARHIELKFPSAALTFTGKNHFLKFVVPNFYFHFTSACAILRHCGLPIGKRDFPGG